MLILKSSNAIVETRKKNSARRSRLEQKQQNKTEWESRTKRISNVQIHFVSGGLALHI